MPAGHLAITSKDIVARFGVEKPLKLKSITPTQYVNCAIFKRESRYCFKAGGCCQDHLLVRYLCSVRQFHETCCRDTSK